MSVGESADFFVWKRYAGECGDDKGCCGVFEGVEG